MAKLKILIRNQNLTIDETIFPMRNINSLIKSKVENAWAASNSMTHEPNSIQDAKHH